MDNLQRLREIIADVTQNSVYDINEDSSIRNVDGWDERSQVNILVTIEMDFGVAFTPDEMKTLSSVRRILGALRVQAAA